MFDARCVSRDLSNLTRMSYSLTIVVCDLEKLSFEVRLRSPLTWYQNCLTDTLKLEPQIESKGFTYTAY